MSKEKDITFVRMAYKRKTLCKWSGCPWMVYASLNNGLWKAELRVARTRPSLVNGEASVSSASQQQPWKACIGNDWYHADASFALEISPYTTYFMWLAYRKEFRRPRSRLFCEGTGRREGMLSALHKGYMAAPSTYSRDFTKLPWMKNPYQR